MVFKNAVEILMRRDVEIEDKILNYQLQKDTVAQKLTSATGGYNRNVNPNQVMGHAILFLKISNVWVRGLSWAEKSEKRYSVFVSF